MSSAVALAPRQRQGRFAGTLSLVRLPCPASGDPFRLRPARDLQSREPPSGIDRHPQCPPNTTRFPAEDPLCGYTRSAARPCKTSRELPGDQDGLRSGGKQILLRGRQHKIMHCHGSRPMRPPCCDCLRACQAWAKRWAERRPVGLGPRPATACPTQMAEGVCSFRAYNRSERCCCHQRVWCEANDAKSDSNGAACAPPPHTHTPTYRYRHTDTNRHTDSGAEVSS